MPRLLNRLRAVLGLPRSLHRTSSSEDRYFGDTLPSVAGLDGNVGASRVLLITQPKAGTYLVAEILHQLGLHHTYLHLGESKLQAYDRRALSEGLQHPRLFDVACGLEESRKLIRLGELGVSHVPFSRHIESHLKGFKIVLVRRELRASLVSMARMLLFSERFGAEIADRIRRFNVAGYMADHGQRFIEKALQIHRWKQSPNVLSIKMEELSSDTEVTIRRMIDHLGLEAKREPSRIWKDALCTPTLTSSEAYPKLTWTEEDEDCFVKIGGPSANRALGYLE